MQPLITADVVVQSESSPHLPHLLHSAVLHRFTQHKKLKLIENHMALSPGCVDILLGQTTLHFSADASAHFSAVVFAGTPDSRPFDSFQLNSFSIQVIQIFQPFPTRRAQRSQCQSLQLESLSLCFHLSHGQTNFTPTHAAANSCHRPDGHQAASARAEGCMEDQGASGTGATGSSSQTGAGLRGSTEEQSGHVHPREDLLGYPSCLDSTLQHIVRQLDILTQVRHSQKILNCWSSSQCWFSIFGKVDE